MAADATTANTMTGITAAQNGYTEPYESDDPYAADAEEASSTFRLKTKRSRSLRSAGIGSAAASAREDQANNRLRQRPTAKQATASEIPGLPRETTTQALARGYRHARHGCSHHLNDSCSCHGAFWSSDIVSPQIPSSPPPTSPPISPRWASLPGANNNSNSNSNSNSNHHYHHHHHLADNQPAARSAGNDPSSFSAPATPLQSPTRKSFASYHSQTSSRFPGLSSHPPLVELTARQRRPSAPGIRERPELEDEDDDDDDVPRPKTAVPNYTNPYHDSNPNTLTLGSSRSNSPSLLPFSRRAAEDPAMAVENFSRPRKPSVTRPNPPMLLSGNKAPAYHAQGETPIVTPQLSAWPRQRGPSVSSNRSVATFSSFPSTRTRASNDRLNATYRTIPRTTTPTTTTVLTAPPTASGGMVSPGLSRPQMAYSREDGNMTLNKKPSLSREAVPWMVDEETRSSYRSQLTGSTTHGTMYSNAGTERSSIGTKNSSRTSVSMNYGGATDDNGLSLEDVMGMYEKGFADSTGAEDNDYDSPRKGANSRSRSRSTSHSQSRSSSRSQSVGIQIREAMDDSLPLPNRTFSPHESNNRPLFVRDSAAFFRNSGLPRVSQDDQSLPQAHDEPTPRIRHKATDSSSSKHDSAKLLDADDHSMLGRNVSTKSTRTHRSTPSLTKGPRPSASTPDLKTVASNDEPPVPATQPATSVNNQLFSAPEEDDPSSRDRYGFRKHNQYITREQYDAWDSEYSLYLARRKKKWMAYLKDSGLIAVNPDRFPQRTAKTKRFIRKGIPPEWRGAAWFYYAGGPSILAKHAGVYDELVKRSQTPGEAKEVDVEAIERDLHRTFPDNASFRFSTEEPEDGGDGVSDGTSEPKIISSLRRVLLAFALYNPQIGYCQSLNFLAGLLLLFVETEEQAFWLLNVITILHLPGTHEMSLEGSKVDLGVLMGAVKDSMPGVWAKVGSELDGEPPRPQTQGTGSVRAKKASRKAAKGAVASAERLPPITLCMTAWFMSCFIGTLPIETTLRVWDVFFYEGSRTLFRVALGIFKLGENEIKAVQDPMEMFGVVQALPRRLLDCNMVMEATFRRRNGFGHLSQESIDERRNERREAIKEARRLENQGVTAAGIEAESGVKRKNTIFGRRRG